MKLIVSILIALAVSASAVEKARFDNYRVYSASVDNELQMRVLRELSEISDSYNFFDEPTRVGSSVEILVAPHKFDQFSELTERYSIRTELMHKNWQENIDEEARYLDNEPIAGVIDWTSYHSHQAINDWLDAIGAEFPQWTTVSNIGISHEGRTLKAIKISKRAGNRAIFIEANIHAREWISGATATYVINELLRSTDPEFQGIANTVDWYIIPISNPDGYEFTRNSNRNWRKTRRPSSLTCIGTDPNRNWTYNWLVPDENGNVGASTNACSDTFAGSAPFSEPEVKAIEDYLAVAATHTDIYLSFHSYGHYLLFPYGHMRSRVPNFLDHADIGVATGDRIFARDGIRYTIGSVHEALYASAGSSVDHAYGHHHIPIGYTYEMRGNGVYGNFGFVLPPNLIIPNCLEVMDSLATMVEFSRTRGLLLPA